MRNLFGRFQERITSFLKNKKTTTSSLKDINTEIEKVPLSGDVIDIETAENPDRLNNVKFNTTENSELAKGAPKAQAYGIDKFGDEDDIVDPDLQLDDSLRGTSDLSQRFYTHGMDRDENQKSH